MTRGQRNNNPANIRNSSSKWKGMTEVQTDKEFVTFIDMWWGIRALLVILRTYYFKYKLVTCSQVISRFAPPNENNTLTYIKFAQEQVFYDGNVNQANEWRTPIDPSENTRRLARAICWIESKVIVDEEDIDLALELL